MREKLSVTIITFNEESNIGRCLQSVQPLADEIIVVDSFSTDDTKNIASSYGVRFIENPFKGHIEQKNFALQLVSHNWVLSLDADEVLSEELRNSIADFMDNPSSRACRVNRLTNYCGRWIRHGGWYPDRKVRLWKTDMGKWSGENPHDRVELSPGIKPENLPGDLLHYSFPSIASHVLTANNFSGIAAQALVDKKKHVTIGWHMLLNPGFTFFKKYFFQLGFLDGFYGFVIAVLSAYSNFLKYSKAYSLYNQHETSQDTA